MPVVEDGFVFFSGLFFLVFTWKVFGLFLDCTLRKSDMTNFCWESGTGWKCLGPCFFFFFRCWGHSSMSHQKKTTKKVNVSVTLYTWIYLSAEPTSVLLPTWRGTFSPLVFIEIAAASNEKTQGKFCQC